LGDRDDKRSSQVDELVKLVTEKTGLSEEMARTVIDTVIGFLKQKLPAPVAGQIDGLLEGTSSTGGLGGIAQGLDGLLGKR
jgi:hypothetical protein